MVVYLFIRNKNNKFKMLEEKSNVEWVYLEA